MIGIFDISKEFSKLSYGKNDVIYLDMYESNFPKIDVLIVNMINKEDTKMFTKQSLIVDKYSKSHIPVIIYDNNMIMTNKEYKWLKKFNVIFFEPFIRTRIGFQYLPNWTEILTIDNFNLLNDNEREIDLAYEKKALKIKTRFFEKYYTNYKILNRNKKVIIEDNINWSNVKSTIAIDIWDNYMRGYIDPYIFKVMKYGCIPFIPKENRYFNFCTTIKSHEEIDVFINANANEAIINEFYKEIEMYYPEFTIKYASEVINSCLMK